MKRNTPLPHILEITDDNAHESIPPYLRPKPAAEEKPQKKYKHRVFDGNAERLFSDLEKFVNGATADELIELREKEDNDGLPKVNQVAPVLSGLRSDGIVVWSGRRRTRTGASANIHVVVDDGKHKFMSQLARVIH